MTDSYTVRVQFPYIYFLSVTQKLYFGDHNGRSLILCLYSVWKNLDLGSTWSRSPKINIIILAANIPGKSPNLIFTNSLNYVFSGIEQEFYIPVPLLTATGTI
jgi:hypothetical protein